MASSTSPAPSSVSGSEPASVRPVACLRCRQRRSYCSKTRPQCSRCRDAGFECIYEEARKITVNESYLRLLEEKVKAYEGAPDTVTRERAVAGPSRTRGGDEYGGNDEEIEDEHPLLEPFNQLTVDRLSTSFKGPGNADNFLRSMRKLSGFYGDDGSLDLNPNFYEPGALPSRRELLAVHARLPPLDICRRLFAAQYTYIGTIFAFSDPETFEKLLLQARRGPPDLSDKDACLCYAKVLVILAFGQLYSVNQWIDFKGPPGFEYFTHALQLLPDPHEEGSILCVETLALMGYFFQNMNRRDAAFLYIGMAMRMAISLGLHQEVSSRGQETELDDVSREHRRRVWWSIYSLDRILSIKSGNPVTIQDEDIGVHLPSKLPGEAEYCPAVVLRHYTVVSRILGEVTKLIYRRITPKSGRRLMASVQKIILSLSDWNRDLPDELRFDPAKLSISRESVSTFSHYYQCINMTARPLLFHVVQKRLGGIRADPSAKERDWREGLSQTTVRVIEMCVSAAQDTINMMAVAAQRDLVATYGYMDGEHIFSAAIVLVMACVAFPTQPGNTAAMNTGLDLLRGMAERGNSHMGARYELLAHLRNVIVPGGGGYQAQVMRHSQQPMPLFPSGAHAFSPVAPGVMAAQPMTASLVAAQAAMVPGPVLTPPGEGVGPTPVGLSATNQMFTMGGGQQQQAKQEEEMPIFSMAHENALREPFWDESMSNATNTDFGLWEEGFANPAVDAGFDLRQWTQTAQMVVDGMWDENLNVGGNG
ncbi:fungal-specific transcription factor [Coniochaeta sp. 2T2.1]|nr:fungal-specific transcription factor [Coniochaeta sp. 2T2.1]